ncbi:hypothetical protein [Streptomyces chrestomyceticus]|uniref:hypothetical protein n=1 Tax=Streptomyces chrestomyceticus TaxID=68185 RepID=UPI0019CFB5C1|nr:hypothetical protein [Streptomyces chrestomyceticus]
MGDEKLQLLRIRGPVIECLQSLFQQFGRHFELCRLDLVRGGEVAVLAVGAQEARLAVQARPGEKPQFVVPSFLSVSR